MANAVEWFAAVLFVGLNVALLGYVWWRRRQLSNRIQMLDSTLLDSQFDIEEVIQAPFGSQILTRVQNVNPNQLVMIQMGDGRIISVPYYQAVQMMQNRY